jgi:hypothetical protein
MARSVHIGIRRGKAHSRRASLLLVAATALLAVAFSLGSSARAGGPPALEIGPISVNDGTAVVTGTVGEDPTAEVDLQVNGENVGIDASGTFHAVVDLDGESFVVLRLASSDGEITAIRIPVAILGNGVDGVLDDLEQAGVSLEIPPDGFQIVDGQMPVVTGRVLNRDELASLTVNGRDVLSILGQNGGFSTQLLGPPSQNVTVVSTDKKGVSETTSFRMSTVTSTIKTAAGTSVSALGAKGVVIAKIRFDKRQLLSHRRLGIVVQVKDRRGYLIRGAALRLKGMPLRYLANGAMRAGFTNRLGLKRFAYKLQKRAFTDSAPRRLTLVVRASTPRAAAKKVAKVRLPLVAST